jgi:hypothetical protein
VFTQTRPNLIISIGRAEFHISHTRFAQSFLSAGNFHSSCPPVRHHERHAFGSHWPKRSPVAGAEEGTSPRHKNFSGLFKSLILSVIPLLSLGFRSQTCLSCNRLGSSRSRHFLSSSACCSPGPRFLFGCCCCCWPGFAHRRPVDDVGRPAGFADYDVDLTFDLLLGPSNPVRRGIGRLLCCDGQLCVPKTLSALFS